jgi:hypothetical protein
MISNISWKGALKKPFSWITTAYTAVLALLLLLTIVLGVGWLVGLTNGFFDGGMHITWDSFVAYQSVFDLPGILVIAVAIGAFALARLTGFAPIDWAKKHSEALVRRSPRPQYDSRLKEIGSWVGFGLLALFPVLFALALAFGIVAMSTAIVRWFGHGVDEVWGALTGVLGFVFVEHWLASVIVLSIAALVQWGPQLWNSTFRQWGPQIGNASVRKYRQNRRSFKLAGLGFAGLALVGIVLGSFALGSSLNNGTSASGAPAVAETTSSAPAVVESTSSAPAVVESTSSAPAVVESTSSAPAVVESTSSAPAAVAVANSTDITPLVWAVSGLALIVLALVVMVFFLMRRVRRLEGEDAYYSFSPSAV